MNDTERKIYQDVMAEFDAMINRETEEITFKEFLRLKRFYMYAVNETVKAIEKHIIDQKDKE